MNDQERSIIRALQHSQPLLKRLPNRRPKAAAETGSTTMPRDLDHEKPLPVIPLITESPNRMPDSPVELSTDSPAPVPGSKAFVVVPKSKQYTPTNLHPYTRPLTVSDIEAVVALENAAFPDPNERASREKVRPFLFGRCICSRPRIAALLLAWLQSGLIIRERWLLTQV